MIHFYFTLLFAVKHTIRPSLCGLEGNVQVYVNFPDGEQCTGMLSDWNAHECRPGFRLSLDLEKTCPRPVISESEYSKMRCMQ